MQKAVTRSNGWQGRSADRQLSHIRGVPDRRQFIKYLRFQLNELSAENGHHTFEHICREVARARLATNLVPATGPVAGGGDAGRDFETFKSYLPKQLGEHGALGTAATATDSGTPDW
jgi:hypothetical protein